MVFDKMEAICLDLKWLGFWISDPIWNPDHLQTNIFLTYQNPDPSKFQIPTVLKLEINDSAWLISIKQACANSCKYMHDAYLFPFCV